MSRANPMLDLPAFGVLRELPEHTRRDLALVLTDLARDADGRAKTSWERHKGPMAAYWRAVSTYARHTARALVAVEARDA